MGGTSYLKALFLNRFFEIDVFVSLLVTIPLSILSSIILLPSIDSVEENKREFLIYESLFSDIVGIIVFYTVLGLVDPAETGGVWFYCWGSDWYDCFFYSNFLFFDLCFSKTTGEENFFVNLCTNDTYFFWGDVKPILFNYYTNV